MAFLSDEQAAAIAGTSVRIAVLAELRFAGLWSRLWTGFGRVEVAGAEWDGAGTMGSVSGLTQPRGAEARKTTLSLSGVAPGILAAARNSVAEVNGRRGLLWLQLFDDAGRPLGARIAALFGTMGNVTIRRAPEGDGQSRVVSLDIEGPFASRARPPLRRFADADHQQSHPGDRFFEFASQQQGKTHKWPDF